MYPRHSMILMQGSLFAYCLAWFILFTVAARAGDSVVLDADQQFHYAASCYEKGDYEAAGTEYKRFVHFFPGDPRVADAMYAIAMSGYQRELYQQSIMDFTGTADRFPGTPLAMRAFFKISDCYMRLKDSGNALITLQNLLRQTDDVDVRDEAYASMGWIYIERAEFDRAKAAFQSVSLRNQTRYDVEKLTGKLEKEGEIPEKSPGVAGLLSIVPGGGYFYCGRYQDALVAFLLNGALILAAWEAFDQDIPALGGVICAVEFGFYAGNIYGGIASAHKYNAQKTRDFIESLKENAKITVSGVKDGLALSVQIPF